MQLSGVILAVKITFVNRLSEWVKFAKNSFRSAVVYQKNRPGCSGRVFCVALSVFAFPARPQFFKNAQGGDDHNRAQENPHRDLVGARQLFAEQGSVVAVHVLFFSGAAMNFWKSWPLSKSLPQSQLKMPITSTPSIDEGMVISSRST